VAGDPGGHGVRDAVPRYAGRWYTGAGRRRRSRPGADQRCARDDRRRSAQVVGSAATSGRSWSTSQSPCRRTLRLGARGGRARTRLQGGSQRMEVTPLRVGAVGCGYWGPNVIRNLAELPGFDLYRVCDVDPRQLQPVAERHPHARATSRVEDILDDPHIEAMYLATPVSTHYALTTLAFGAGKQVRVEKPVATTVEEAEELADLAAARGLTLMVGHTFVFSPPVRKVKQLIDERLIGPIYYIETTRVNLGLFQ